ncbi:MAG: GNAT family protein [Pseudomonadota bacterium]
MAATRDLSQWSDCALPGDRVLTGRLVRIEPLRDAHLSGLYAAVAGPENDDIWRYMPIGPFHDQASFKLAADHWTGPSGWRVMTFMTVSCSTMLGVASYLRLRPDQGSCEIGMVAHGKSMRRRPAATEAHYLLARHVFEDLGYRRYEWKCNASNQASMAAAQRYGFSYEGTFRQDMVVKGENRDTAWWSMLDREWPGLKARFEAWLDPANFDDNGMQRKRLEDC